MEVSFQVYMCGTTLRKENLITNLLILIGILENQMIVIMILSRRLTDAKAKTVFKSRAGMMWSAGAT